MSLGMVASGALGQGSRKHQDVQKPAFSSSDDISAKKIYRKLLICPKEATSQRLSRHFLQAKLAAAKSIGCDLPDDIENLQAWSETIVAEVSRQYQQYLECRSKGGPRQYFHTRSHALSFITKVAPTKLVDGAWLYGVLAHWRDIRFRSLMFTYLEELGDGEPDQNHVLLYKRLMALENCEADQELKDEYYVQGALQLSLGYHADEFLPELIGYNLGYEQLPLHLLITAYELRELGMDPCYFTLHVTIDNASTGHAHKAVQAVLENLPAGHADAQTFYRRVWDGYRLNGLGVSSTEIIRTFGLRQEVLDILKRKSRVAQVHSDYCRVGGRTINEWLADPEQMESFLDALIAKGWIKPDQDPENSRFWRLMNGSQAKMFGVFSHYELAIIHNWLGGAWLATSAAALKKNGLAGSATSLDNSADAFATPDTNAADKLEEERLHADLLAMPLAERVRRLIDLMAPGRHHSASGLMATKMFGDLVRHAV